jgi:hypothetical protein
MANTRTFKTAFVGGEVSPEMFGRIDDAKYQSGIALCRNFVPTPQGPAENRAGFAFVREVKDSTKKVKLIPFTYSTTQTMVIELGAGYFRFHTLGSTLRYLGSLPHPYEVSNSYSEADLFDIHYVQSGDILTLVHPNYAPQELRRLGATNWQLSTVAFTPSIAPPAVLVTGNAKGTDYFYQYVVSTIAADGLTESVASNPAQGTSVAISYATNANPGVMTTSVAHGLAVGNSVYISGCGGMTQLNGNYYVVNTVPTTTTLTLETLAGAPVSTLSFGGYTAGGSIYRSGVKNNLFVTGGANTITWDPVAGATGYNVYKFSGGIYGYIGRTVGSSFVDDNIAADLGKTPHIYETVFNAAGEYPGAVSYFEQRRCFAGSANKPQSIWMTKSGTESAMSYSLPIKDDDRIAFRVAAREANTIRHIVPLTQLLLMTSSAEWRVSPLNSDAITPSTISVRPQSYVGASNVQPVVINNTLIYGASRGGHVRELAYNWQANGFITGDLALRAAHLFDGYDVVDMAYSKAPFPLVWFVSTSGKLLGLTYVPEQQIGAWHQHDTDGAFESCAVVAEYDEDVLYVVVRRTINGAVKRYVERLESRRFDDTHTDAFFVDSGLTYTGAPTSTLTGLGHLEGKTVSILADGAVHPPRVVTSGAITLERTSSLVHVGLPIEADIQTLPLVAQIDASFGQGRAKNINKVWLRVFRSSSVFAGPDAAHLADVGPRRSESYGTAPAIRSEEITLLMPPAWQSDGQIFVRQSNPLPITLVSIAAEVAMGG